MAEYEQLLRLGVYEETAHTGEHLLSTKGVFAIKRDKDGNVRKLKYRSVVRGFLQIKGKDYDDVFAPVAASPSTRLILSIASMLGLFVRQFDVSGAFLNATMDHRVLIKPPALFPMKNPKNVLLLRKAQYGCKQSARLWYLTIKKRLESAGLRPCSSDPCVFFRRTNGKLAIVSIHVDDGIVCADTRKEVMSITRHLNKKFATKSGPVSVFLGMQVSMSTGESI